MATQSILVEDCSPLIQYAPDGAWADAEVNDTLASSYSGGSYHATSIGGATATFQFRGSGFVITGGRRPGYGSFSISLDGRSLFEGDPSPGPSLVNNTLASVSGLSNEVHTVVLTNTGGGLVDIDAITFEAQIVSAGTDPSVTIIDDGDPRIHYLPPDSWSLNSRPEFQNGTLHFSQAPNATASLQFTGNAFAYYGTVSPDHADVSITIDDETTTMPSHSFSRVRAVRTKVLMYWVDGLANQLHTMTITKVQSNSTGPFVDVDSFIVYADAQPTTVGNGTSNLPTATPKPVASRSGVIIGASIAGVVALLLVLAGLILFFRHRRRRPRPAVITKVPSPITPPLPMQGMMESGMVPFPTSSGNGSGFPLPPSAPFTPLRRAQVDYKRSSKLSIAPSYYGDPNFVSDEVSERGRHTTPGVPYPSARAPPVPRLAMPSASVLSRLIPPTVVAGTSSLPSRPRPPSRPTRPPTLDIDSLE